MGNEGQETEETQTPPAPPEGEKPEGEEKPLEGAEQTAENGENGKQEAAEGEEEKEGGEEVKADEEEAPAEKKRAGGWQRKIERLERELEAARLREIQALRTSQSQTPGQAPTGGDLAKADPVAQAREFFRSVAREEREAAEAQARQQSIVAKFVERTQAARARYADFDDVVSMVDIPTESPLGQALLTSEQAPDIMYRLATSPAELARINALPPLEAAREIGRLEAKLSSSTAAPSKPKPANRPPAPPTRTGGSASSLSSEDLDKLSFAEYKRRMRSSGR